MGVILERTRIKSLLTFTQFPMITKAILASGVAAGVLMTAVPFAFAQATQTTSVTGTVAPVATAPVATAPTANVAAKIACVGTAVAAREAALGTAVTAHSSAVSAAYTARATALSTAYSQTTMSAVRSSVKAAWSSFNSSTKSAQKAWQSAQNTAWKTYRAAAVACKAPTGTGDGMNSDSEISGR